METFPSNIYPEYDGNKRSISARVLESKLGDGYSQRCADGLNFLDEKASWVFKLTDTEADTLETFLVDRGGWDAFNWQPPRHATSKKWICKGWEREYEPATKSTITMTTIRVWDL
jgi:phage-related protein